MRRKMPSEEAGGGRVTNEGSEGALAKYARTSRGGGERESETGLLKQMQQESGREDENIMPILAKKEKEKKGGEGLTSKIDAQDRVHTFGGEGRHHKYQSALPLALLRTQFRRHRLSRGACNRREGGKKMREGSSRKAVEGRKEGMKMKERGKKRRGGKSLPSFFQLPSFFPSFNFRPSFQLPSLNYSSNSIVFL
jgi:hypothetical protein